MIVTTRRRFAGISDGLVMGILIGLFLGAVIESRWQHTLSDAINWHLWWDSLLQNFGTEMLGAFLTFILIEVLIGDRREKSRLIRNMGSRDNAIAVVASRELRDNSWLMDGSLRGKDFFKANRRALI